MKPILNYRGQLVTPPENGTICYSIDWVKHEVYEVEFREGVNGQQALNSGNLYATREAAEMALIRAQCKQRLEELAYENWLPDDLDYHGSSCGAILTTAPNIFLNIWFKNTSKKMDALNTITPEERAAWLYIYKPEEE